jgi:hypothetical protein
MLDGRGQRIFSLIILLLFRYNQDIRKRSENPHLEAGKMKSWVVLLTVIAVFTLSPTSMAAEIYINGGHHIFDDATFENDSVYLDYDSYTNTQVVLIEGGIIGQLAAYGDSFVEIGGVTLEEYIPGGIIKESLIVNESAHVFIHGGSIGNTLEVFQNGIITLFGTDFQVTDLDGVTTTLRPFIDTVKNFATLVSEEGQLPYYTGTITGTLADGSIVNNTFKIYESGYGGDIHIRRKLMAYGPVMVSLSQQKTGLLLKNNSILTIVGDDGDNIVEGIIVNSLAKDAVLVQGKASISADFLQIAGTIDIKGSLSYPEEMHISDNIGEDPWPDIDLDEPDYAGLPDLCPINPNTGKASPVVITEGEWILEPGYYSAGVIIQDAAVSCLPGIYHLGGGSNAPSGLILKGDAVVDANEVMFHIIGTGQVSIGKDAALTAIAPTSGDYKNLVFFQSRDNNSGAVFKGIADCGGRLYFPTNHVEVAGNVLCSMLMADTIELSVNAELTVNPNYPLSE